MSSISNKKAAVAKCSNDADLTSQGPLFAKAVSPTLSSGKSLTLPGTKLVDQNWKENPFFKSLQNDQTSYLSNMGNKYNLNFKKDDIFDTKEKDSEITSASSSRKANIVWQPIKPQLEQVRWNSYNEFKTKNSNSIENKILITRQTSGIRNIETSKVSELEAKCGKSSIGPARITQLTRDTNTGVSMIDGQITDRTINEDPFENRLSNAISVFSDSALESSRDLKITEGVFVKPSDVLKSKPNSQASEHLFESQKDTASQSQSTQVPQMMPPAPPKLRKNKKKLVAHSRLGKVPNHQDSPQILFSKQSAPVSLNYNKQMVANQSAIQLALRANQEVNNRQKKNEEPVRAPTSKSFVRQVKSMDRQKLGFNIGGADKQQPENTSAPIQANKDEWLQPAIIQGRSQKQEDVNSNFDGNLIGKRPNNNSIKVSSNDSQVHQFQMAKTSKKIAKPECATNENDAALNSKSKSSEKIKVGQSSPQTIQPVSNRHAQVGMKPKAVQYSSFLSNFTKRDLKEKTVGDSGKKIDAHVRKSMERLKLGPKMESIDKDGPAISDLKCKAFTTSFIKPKGRDTPVKTLNAEGVSPKTKLSINLNNVATNRRAHNKNNKKQ